MSKLSYLARVMSGVRLKKMNQMIDIVHDKCGQNKVKTFFDMCWCGARYGAGYYDYVMFGFYNMNGRQRDTYLTRVRNKKVIDHMNDLSYSDEFDDKLRFNQRFAKYLGRKTLNGETATLAEFTDFITGQEAIFAKINHGDCGRGVNKLYVKDYESPAVMLDYIRRNQLVVLEQVLPQHPDMARLHPSSVNTMRILTDLVDGEVHVAYISVKMGRGDGYCDNSGQGGVLCRVDPETGKIISPATDDYFNVYDRHPDTGVEFVGYQLPMVPEAIALANDTIYGLAGGVFTHQLERALRVVKEVRAGITWVNAFNPTYNEAPWGGYKMSGIGRELGVHGLEEYQEIKQVNINLTPGPAGWYEH